MSADSSCYNHLNVALVMCPPDEDGFIYGWDAFDVSELNQTGFYIFDHRILKWNGHYERLEHFNV